MMLDKRPDLTRRLRKVTSIDQGEARKTLVEGTAESIQRAFTICLTERSTNRNGVGRDGKPEGKKVGIYSFANLVLKLLFQVCGKDSCIVFSKVNRVSVSKNTIGKSAIYEYFPTFSSSISLPRQRACYISLPSWSIPFLQQSLFPCTALP